MSSWLPIGLTLAMVGCGSTSDREPPQRLDIPDSEQPYTVDSSTDSSSMEGRQTDGSATDSSPPDSNPPDSSPADASPLDGSPIDASPTPDAGSSFLYDDFNGPLYTLTAGGRATPNGLWRTGYVSQGFAKTVEDPTNSANRYLVMAPKLDVLRSARLDSTKAWKGIHGRMRARLDEQLQPPISWYTIWPFIAYVDQTTHYYFNLKTNGWELGKKDNDHPIAEELQEFLRLGSSPKAVLGQWYTIEWWVVKDAASNNMRIRVDVDGVKVVEMLDNQPWQRNGTTGGGASDFFINADKRVSLYNEASQVSWDDVYVEEATTIPQ